MLKFGQIIDLDSLDKMGRSRAVLDMLDKVRTQELQHQAELSRANANSKHAQEEMLIATQQNTEKLREIAALTEKQHRSVFFFFFSFSIVLFPLYDGGARDNYAHATVLVPCRLENELNSSVLGGRGSDMGPVIRRDAEERMRLVQVVKLQSKEVDALKAEINMLRRKGGA